MFKRWMKVKSFGASQDIRGCHPRQPIFNPLRGWNDAKASFHFPNLNTDSEHIEKFQDGKGDGDEKYVIRVFGCTGNF
jgi:hypothetical protein